MMRDLDTLSSQHFDVLVIGGGIQGATLAYELAKSGVHTALVEKNDFGAETSANSLKIIHGGLRYLQHLDFPRIRESILSRRRMMAFAPHLVRPLPCVIPTAGHGIQGKELLQLALWVNDLAGYDRNRGIPENRRLPKGVILTKRRVLRFFPAISHMDFNGGMLWYDALAMDTERLVLEFIQKADAWGASVANYARARDLMITADGKRFCGAVVEDQPTGKIFEIKAKTVINVAGPWFEELLKRRSPQFQSPQKWAKGVNIVFTKTLSKTHALGLEGHHHFKDPDAVVHKGKRFYFFVPWMGHMMAGTDYEKFDGNPDDFRVTASDLANFLNQMDCLLPGLQLSKNDVSHFHGGLVPIRDTGRKLSENIQLEKHASIIDHEQQNGIKGLFSIKSVKFTTAWQTAIKTTHLVMRKTSVTVRRIPTARRRRDEKQLRRKNVSPAAVDPAVLLRIQRRYGNGWTALTDYIQKKNLKPSVICRDSLLTDAEILFGIEKEMALHLADVIFRRTGIGGAGCPPLETVNRITGVMGEFLNWPAVRREEEIRRVLDRYRPISHI